MPESKVCGEEREKMKNVVEFHSFGTVEVSRGGRGTPRCKKCAARVCQGLQFPFQNHFLEITATPKHR